jgi:hypothetical protein
LRQDKPSIQAFYTIQWNLGSVYIVVVEAVEVAEVAEVAAHLGRLQRRMRATNTKTAIDRHLCRASSLPHFNHFDQFNHFN